MIFLLFSLSVAGLKNGIFEKVFNEKIIIIDSSGSSKQRINGSIEVTKPEYAIYPWNKRYDWCSNCAHSYDEHPWITFSLDKRKIKLNGYFVRAGCCYQNACCCDDEVYYYCLDCCLYSWSLQISDDNTTWTEVHRVEKDDSMRKCNEKSFQLDKDYTTTYVRLIQNKPCPGDPPCIALNRFELYGETLGDNNGEFDSFLGDDDDVSIIGHISKNGRVIDNA